MIQTRQQAIALHDAIEARTDAYTDFHNCALMPPRQMTDERLAASAERWVVADRAVAELSHGLALDAVAPLPVGDPVETVAPPAPGDGGNGNAVTGGDPVAP